jgi:hypothetical protein
MIVEFFSENMPLNDPSKEEITIVSMLQMRSGNRKEQFNIYQYGIQNGWPKPVLKHKWAAKVTLMKTALPRLLFKYQQKDS